MTTLKYITTAILLCICTLAGAENNERWYQEKYCADDKEHVLSDRTRVDCLNDDYAIEFDFGKKWAECVGQALHYAAMTRKKPGCALIDTKDGLFDDQMIRIKRLLPLPAGIWAVDNESIKQIQ